MNPDPNTPNPPPAPKKGPNWLIILPCGCLSLIGLVVVAVCALVFGVFGAMKSSPVYAESLAKAQASPLVQEALGTPIKDTFVVTGSVSTENGVEKADLTYPISGPKGAASVHAAATKEGGSWVYTEMSVTPEGKEPINLLEE